MGPALPDMPWEERPAGSKEVMWRYSANPIIGRDALSTSNSVFNSAVVPFKKGKYAGVQLNTTADAVRYYVKAYNATKKETAKYKDLETEEISTYYKIVQSTTVNRTVHCLRL